MIRAGGLMAHRPLPAYVGDEPYIFVTYSREDSDLAYPQIRWLQDQGFNLWWDEGIGPGAVWRRELTQAIRGCSLFLYLTTPNSIASEQCTGEVNCARDEHHRPVLAVHLLKTVVPDALAHCLSNGESILQHMLEPADYERKLVSTVTTYLDRPLPEFPARRAPASDEIIRRASDVARRRLVHVATRLLARTLPSKRTKELEFEYRYRRYVAEYGEADSDIVIATFSKSGTTWSQIILYQLTTAGDMDFDHLFDISPWVWYSAMRRVPPMTTPSPRILKSHDDYRRFRRGRRGRFIFVLRDGRDVCVSLFHHRRDFKRFEGTFQQHFDNFLYNTEYNWFDHLRPWLENAYRLPIRYVRFEDLKRDFDNTVRGIADYCGIEVDEATMARTRERSQFEAMKDHESQLGPRNAHFEGISDSPYFVRQSGQFIRRGEIGEGLATLSEAQLVAYQDRFDRSLAGFELVADYR